MMKKTWFISCCLAALIGLNGCSSSEKEPSQTSTEVQSQVEQLLRLGKRTQETGDHANALGFYQRAYMLDTQNRDALFLLAETTKHSGDLSAVAQVYTNGLNHLPEDTGLLRRYGNILIEQNKLPQAIIQLKKALSIKPNDAQALNSLGVAYDLSGLHDDAQDQYEKSLDEAASDLDTLNNYALSLALSEDYDKAIKTLSPYGKDSTAPKRLRLNLAMLYGLSGDVEMAKKVASQLLDREAVENNLRIYEEMRKMNKAARKTAVLGK
ncbi:putative TPR repeat-containing protein [Candidatus Terasakiella magnetica]|uniref:Putative TPR repeat-containing protein n=1 Tax=Candidatus Terasakiella magnetica TaxID=1867952 RepID=A0A1C3REJ1_9PROT|nr:tetratricopeptide repeat protein [Candidatus Terasakiella magnetica]SCA55710.1 putative TPR repeat-containing protein [Candidatus Terasakiella magnetica]